MQNTILPQIVASYASDVLARQAITAVQHTLAAGSVTEFRGYRLASGASEVVVTYAFTDMAAWYEHDDVQQVIAELRTMATNITLELWVRPRLYLSQFDQADKSDNRTIAVLKPKKKEQTCITNLTSA